MKARFASVLLIMCLAFVAQAHSGHQAFYTLYNNNGYLALDIRLEEADIQQMLAGINYCEAEQELAFCAANYLLENSSYYINGQPVYFNLNATLSEEGYLQLQFTSEAEAPKVETVEVENTCFVELDKTYENIVYLEFSGYVSYKLNRHRTIIYHSY